MSPAQILPRSAAAIVAILLWQAGACADLPTADRAVPGEGAAEELAARIDELIALRWREEGVTPAPLADDAEFFRRISLDVCGRIPPASAVRDFLADDHPAKRAQAVQRLLAGPTYIMHYTNLWRAAMIPEAEAEQEIRFALPGFEAWLRSRIAENRSFSQIVDEMLTLPVGENELRAFNQPDRPTPAAFYQAKEGKPERLAAAAARLFLGVRIDCAQCHDHPFDRWKRQQFWQTAAFFTDLRPPPSVSGTIAATLPMRGTILIPDTDTTVQATFLDGTQPDWSRDSSPRAQLANWIVDRNNPYFAKAAVNRIWSYHFGIGLVEPMDDFSAANPPSHPELLDLLANAFVEHGYDFKFMIRAITSSHAYQLTSRRTDDSQRDPRLFSRQMVRGLTPEQLFDSLAQATGYRQPFDPEQPLNFNNDPVRQEFLATFANQSESGPDRTTTILQALSLMNGKFVADATDLSDSRTLAAVIDAPFLDQAKKVDALYLATVSRLPTAAERAHLLDYVAGGGTRGDPQSALADVFWVLLNSSEFMLNH